MYTESLAGTCGNHTRHSRHPTESRGIRTTQRTNPGQLPSIRSSSVIGSLKRDTWGLPRAKSDPLFRSTNTFRGHPRYSQKKSMRIPIERTPSTTPRVPFHHLGGASPRTPLGPIRSTRDFMRHVIAQGVRPHKPGTPPRFIPALHLCLSRDRTNPGEQDY